MELSKLRRGAICLVNFNPSKGKEIGKIRPAVILSKDEDNQILETVVVLPISSQLVENGFPYRIFLPLREGLDKDSNICIYEVRALSKKRIIDVVSSVTDTEMTMVEKALAQVFIDK